MLKVVAPAFAAMLSALALCGPAAAQSSPTLALRPYRTSGKESGAVMAGWG